MGAAASCFETRLPAPLLSMKRIKVSAGISALYTGASSKIVSRQTTDYMAHPGVINRPSAMPAQPIRA